MTGAARRRGIATRAGMVLAAAAMAGLGSGCATGARGPDGPAAASTIDPATVVGQSPAAVRARFGPPELERREGATLFWQYRTEGCVFDVFLVERQRQARVDYVDVRPRGTDPVDKQACLGRIAARHAAAADAG